MKAFMTWADLLAGDVLLTDEDYPVVVVLCCVEAENKFSWTTLDDQIQIVRSPDLRVSGMWQEPLMKCYPTLLRGSERIEL